MTFKMRTPNPKGVESPLEHKPFDDAEKHAYLKGAPNEAEYYHYERHKKEKEAEDSLIDDFGNDRDSYPSNKTRGKSTVKTVDWKGGYVGGGGGLHGLPTSLGKVVESIFPRPKIR